MIFATLRNWFNNQTIIPRLARASLILGIFGFVPGAWFFGVPFIFLYGLYKKDAIAAALISSYERWSAVWQDFAARLGAFVSHQLVNNPFGVFRFFASLFLFSSMTIPFTVLGIYGLYRYPPEKWQEIFWLGYKKAMRFFTVGVAETMRGLTFPKAITLGAAFVIPFAFFLHLGGAIFLLELSMMAAQWGLVYVGFKALFGIKKIDSLFEEEGDAIKWFRTPISNISKNLGKILGMLWGRWFAYEVFTGTLAGSIGPAIGQVQTQGIISGLIPSIISPQSGWFAFNSGYVNVLTSRLSTFLNSIISGLFFSHNMKLWGDFQGYIGPNSFQIFAFMAAGCLIGYGVEKFIDTLYESVKSDAENAALASVPYVNAAKNKANQMKWHAAYTAFMVPVVLTSPGGAAIFTLAGGSVLAAVTMTASAVALSIAGIYGAASGMQNLWQRLFRRGGEERLERALPPVREEPVLLADAILLPQPSPNLLLAYKPAERVAEGVPEALENAPRPNSPFRPS
jgi:hypothetical protein